MATANDGHDRVEVGAGSFDEEASGPDFIYLDPDPLELVGEGVGQTILHDSTAVGPDVVLFVSGASTAVSGFTFEMSTNGERGLELASGASASNVEAGFGAGTPPADTGGFVLSGSGGQSLSNASADLTAGAASQAINVVSDPGVTIEDVDLSAETGITIGIDPSSPAAENVIRRARITVTGAGAAGVSASSGTTTLESSLVRVLADGQGLAVSNTNGLPEAFDLEARHVTLIGLGAGTGGIGAAVQADDVDPGAQLPSLVLRDSIVFGFEQPLRCDDLSTVPPFADDFPTLTTQYSDYPPTGSSIDAGCTFTQTNPLTGDPLFANPASDFHLQMCSQLVDAGTPGALDAGESTTDLDGSPRLVDGNGDGIARRDLGAFERAGLTAPGCGPIPPAGGAPPRSFSADLALRVLRKKGRLAGVLSSDSSSCLLGRVIELFRVRKGPDPRVGTAIAGADGRFKLGRRVGSGRYYAEADPLSLPGGDSCAADRSAKAKLKAP